MSAYVSKKYSWRPGYGYSVKPQIVGEVLEEIEARDGRVTSEAFLDESRDEECPTHDMFEWDDEIAAEKYRLNVAAKIINQLAVEIVYEEPETFEVTTEVKEGQPADYDRSRSVYARSAYINVNPDTSAKAKSHFIDIHTAMTHDDTREIVLNNAIRELKSFESKYAQLSELGGVFAEIDKLIEGKE